MKPAPFTYVRASGRDEALAALRDADMDGKILAGGQSLIPLMNLRLARPATIVDINRITEFDHATRANGTLTFGPTYRQEEALRDRSVSSSVPLLAQAIGHIGHTQIRHRGTVVGSLAHADPAAELPAVAVALDAGFTVERAGDSRTVPASEFFIGPFMTSIESDEMVTEVAFPAVGPATGHAFLEFARRHGDFAVVAVAAAITLDSSRSCIQARIGLAGAGDRAVRATGTEQALIGRRIDGSVAHEAALEGVRSLDPPSDIHGSSCFRKTIALQLIAGAIVEAHRNALRRV